MQEEEKGEEEDKGKRFLVMQKISLISLTFFIYGCTQLLGNSVSIPETQVQINNTDLTHHLEFLAGEQTEGRLTATRGEKLATSYAASLLESFGYLPAGDDGSFFQNFPFITGSSPGEKNSLAVTGLERLVLNRDYRPLSFSKTGAIQEGPVVFAGYGLSVPASDAFSAYDSYRDLNVSGKWVLVFRYFPEVTSPELRQHYASHSSLRLKAMLARNHGAIGLLVASGPLAQVKEELVRFERDGSAGGMSISVISITNNLAAQLLEPSGRTLESLQRTLDAGSEQVGFPLPGVAVSAKIDIRHSKRTGRNVIASLRGEDPASWERNPPVIIGAHIDHLGHGGNVESLARPEERNEIHYGADDNASGVAAVLEVAELLANQSARGILSPKRDLVIALWSGEEFGTIGSSHFIETQLGHGHNSEARLAAAYINLDMVGRLREELVLDGIGSSPRWESIIEQTNEQVKLKLRTQKESYLPTDSTPFVVKGVPILSAFTGVHDDYHTPRDTVEKVNIVGVAQVAELVAGVTAALLSDKEIPPFTPGTKPEYFVPRSALRAFLGTVPDYTSRDIIGVKLAGVRPNGPAARAGIQAGDIIVELDGRKIENVYDYTYVLGSVIAGVSIPIKIERNGQLLLLSVIAEPRE